MITNQIRRILLITSLLLSTTIICAQGYSIKKIVIDAGHGGKDPGASGKRSKEKDIALKVALLTGKYIDDKLSDVEVFYTRKTDVYVDLLKRAQIAHEVDADLFISIHVDAVASKSVSGPSTYVLGLHRTDDNLRVAQKENAVIKLEDNYEDKYEGFDPAKPESYIIFNFVQDAYLKQSTDLANTIQTEFRTRAGRNDRGVHQSGFLVLRETSMPSVLVELGYITNANEESFLNTKKGQEYMASAIFRAVRDYKEDIENRNHVAISSGTVANPVIKEEIKTEPEPEKTETKPVEKTPAVVVAPIVKKTTPAPKEAVKDVILFKLQILASKTQIPKTSPKFANLTDVGFYNEGGYYKYTLGESEDMNEIKGIKNNVKTRFPDAFIIGFKNGKKLTFAEMRSLK